MEKEREGVRYTYTEERYILNSSAMHNDLYETNELSWKTKTDFSYYYL